MTEQLNLQVITKFMRASWTVPRRLKVKDEACSKFISDIVDHFQGAFKVRILKLYIEKIAANYGTKKKYEFLLELLNLRVPNMFEGNVYTAVVP